MYICPDSEEEKKISIVCKVIEFKTLSNLYTRHSRWDIYYACVIQVRDFHCFSFFFLGAKLILKKPVKRCQPIFPRVKPNIENEDEPTVVLFYSSLLMKSPFLRFGRHSISRRKLFFFFFF